MAGFSPLIPQLLNGLLLLPLDSYLPAGITSLTLGGEGLEGSTTVNAIPVSLTKIKVHRMLLSIFS
jgi:hypothetical protein